jgi:hypothetical protein
MREGKMEEERLENSLIHYGVIALILVVGMLALVTCLAMMTPQGSMMMGMRMQ